ncbi:PREDICTED: putative F-box protein At3g17560 [Camelina sativa]|uniref:F-box protein At3g17560 n=1 Tax=Camelina sativa TaxID=90675 RepID=A0ABM0WKN2_CAMSA|nr:PREDICTED: putative F-box protein At3g17560 [Camelina sativa]
MSEHTRETTKISDLPQKLIDEILSRVTMISLRRLRYDFKRLKDLLKDPIFIKKQIANARSTRKYHVLVVLKYRVYSMCSYINEIAMNDAPLFKRGIKLNDPYHNNLEVDLSQAFHCEGILLCTTKSNMFVVWNMFTGQSKWVEQQTQCQIDDVYALGYVYKELCHGYKILKFRDSYHKELEIYEFSSNSWRNLDAFSPEGYLKSRGVSLKGDVYWLFERINQGNEYSLLSFDFWTETLQCLCVPFQWKEGRHDTIALSAVREEHLSLLYQREATQKMEIWITNEIETTSVSWKRFLTVDFKPHPHMFSRDMSFFIDEEKKIAVCCEKDQEDRIFNKVYIVGEDEYKVSRGFGFFDYRGYNSCPTMFGYVPRLV